MGSLIHELEFAPRDILYPRDPYFGVCVLFLYSSISTYG